MEENITAQGSEGRFWWWIVLLLGVSLLVIDKIV